MEMASQVLKKYEDEFFGAVDAKLSLGRLKRKNVITDSLVTEIGNADNEKAKELLFQHMLRNSDMSALREYCNMAIETHGYPKMQELGQKMLSELHFEGTVGIRVIPSASDPSGSYKSYELDIVLCDMDILKSKKPPLEAINGLYFNAYSLLVPMLRGSFSDIKAVALNAAQMQQVDATEEDVMKTNDLNSLFDCLAVKKKWNDLHFLDVAISQLPRATKDVARLVIGHYRSHLDAYLMAISIKEGKSVFGVLSRNQDMQGKPVFLEIRVAPDIDKYTCKDCLHLWNLFLVDQLKIPRHRIKFCDARPSNSTTLIFMIPQFFAVGLERKLSNPDVVWVIKDLDILRVRVPEMFNVDLREVLPNVPVACIQVGLESGTDFMSMTKKSGSTVMSSLVDPVPQQKKSHLESGLKLILSEPKIEIPFEHDPSNVECRDELDPTDRQKIPVFKTEHNAVSSSILEDTASTTPVKSLILAAGEGRLLDVECLLNGRACKVNDEDEEGRTAVLKAAHKGSITVLQTLVEQYGGNVLHRKEGGRNALLLCAMEGHIAIAQYLAPKMGDHLFDTDDNGYTALHWAAHTGQLPMVRYLVKFCGFDVNDKDKWGNTPLLRAALEGHSDIARFLLQNGSHVLERNNLGSTPLLRAAQNGHADTVRYLLENGSQVNEQNNDGLTPALLAARYGHKAVLQQLCESFGADILHRMKGGLNAFLACALGGHVSVAQYLVPKVKEHLFDTSNNGYSALHWAAQAGHLPMVEYLLKDCGFKAKCRDKSGNTPLLIAALGGQPDVARFLLHNGSHVHEQNAVGQSALQLAVRKGHLDMVKFLVHIYRDLNLMNVVSQGYMDLAEGYHHKHLADYLSTEFPALQRKLKTQVQQPMSYPTLWHKSGDSDC